MATRTTTTPLAILTQSSEWDQWYEDFVAMAETNKILEFVDIDREGPSLTKPVVPISSKEFLENHYQERIREWEAAQEHGAEAVGPRPEPPNGLTDAQRADLNFLHVEYKSAMAEYTHQLRAYSELAAWVRSSVDKSYLTNTSSKSDLRVITRELKSMLAPTEREQKKAARRRYRQVLAEAQTKRMKPEDWLTAWSKAKLDGEKHKIRDLDDEDGVDDFLDAVAAFDPTWAKHQEIEIENARKFGHDSDFSLRKISELFNQQIRKTRASGKANSGSVFTVSETPQNSPCPCGWNSRKHRWKPTDCAVVQIAINGVAKGGRQIPEDRVKKCKEALKQAKWKCLIDLVKESATTTQHGRQDSKEDQGKRDDFVGLTFNPEDLSEGNPDSVFAATQQQHPLHKSTILDNGATMHIVNDNGLLTDIQEASETDYVMSGEGSLKVCARGTRRMANVLDGEDGRHTRDLVLLDVAYVPGFHTNIVSAEKLEQKGLWLCAVDQTLRLGTYEDNDILCHLTKKYGLKLIEYKPISRSYFSLPQSPIAVFNAFQDISQFQSEILKPRPRQRMATSSQPPPPRLDSSDIWHLRACHAGPQALEQLVQRTNGVRIKGPTTVQCTACGTSKATEIISRRESTHKSKQPFYRIFLDIFEFPAAYNGHRYVLLITDEFSGMMFSWSLSSKAEAGMTTKDFEARIKRHTGTSICKIRVDNERAIINLPFQRDSEFQIWARQEGIEIELPPPHTKEPTGGAERPGGINQQRMRCVFGLLPQELWPEVYRAVVWIHNILPSQRNEWKSPKEKLDGWFHQHFRWYRPQNVDFDATRDHRPDWHGIFAYGCRAYPLKPRYKAGKDTNLFKLSPRAHIGYLVGYHASNLYRIWVPKLNRVILSRDVRFNEQEFFDPRKEEQLEAEPIAEYRPPPQMLEPLPQRDWDSVLDEFIYEFDEHVLGFGPEGSNSGVEAAGGTTQPLSQRLLTPQGTTILPTPDPTPQLVRRDAPSAHQSGPGSGIQSPDPTSQQETSSTAGRETAGSKGDFDESIYHDADTSPSRQGRQEEDSHEVEGSQSTNRQTDPDPADDAQDTIVVRLLPPRSAPSAQQPSKFRAPNSVTGPISSLKPP